MNFSFDKGLGNDMCEGDDILSDSYTSMKMNQGFRPAELATLAKIEQKQESGKNVIEIHTGAPLSKSTVEKVKKVISSTKQKPVGEEASKQAQIEEFLKKYKSFNEVPVKDMRHIIPLLLMEVYVEKHGHYTKKVKGLWEKRPEDWPANIPFVDPNNRLKNEGEKNVKPKKELLGQMLTYLAERYTKMKNAAETADCFLLHSNDPLLCFPNLSNTLNDNPSHYVLNLVETSESELRVAEQSVSDQSMTTEHISGYSSSSGYQHVYIPDIHSSLSSMPKDGSLIQSSFSTMEDPLSRGFNEEHGELVEDGLDSDFSMQWAKQMQPVVDARPPEQVVDNEEEQSCMKDWNPLEQIRERTKLKLGYMKMKVLVPPVMQDQLESIHDFLMNLSVAELDDDAMFKLLEKWYKLEKCIDGVKFQQSCKYSNLIQNLHDELASKAVPVMDFMSNTTLKSKENAAAYDEQRMGLSFPADDPQQISSLLNIRQRPGPAGGIVPFPTGSQLEVRYLPSKQSGLNSGCGVSMLSDNCKPIQPAQEDGDAITTENPVPSNELFFFSDEELTDFLSGLNQPELSLPVQESAPGTQSTSQLVGKLQMPVGLSQSVMTGVSVHPWVGGNSALVMTAPCATFSPVTAAPSQLISISSVGSPSTAVAEECINRLSLSINSSSPPLPNNNPVPPTQPLLDQLLVRPKAVGKPGRKRSYPFDDDDEMDETVPGPSQYAPAYNMMIPLVVEEISNNLDKPFLRSFKKRTR